MRTYEFFFFFFFSRGDLNSSAESKLEAQLGDVKLISTSLTKLSGRARSRQNARVYISVCVLCIYMYTYMCTCILSLYVL